MYSFIAAHNAEVYLKAEAILARRFAISAPMMAHYLLR
jgi:hypothetical protein